MSEIVSITAAAQHFKISRPRLSKLIKEFDITKIKQGSTFLVDLEQIHRMFEVLEADGRLRKRSTPEKQDFSDCKPVQLDVEVSDFEKTLLEMRQEITLLTNKVDAMQEQSEIPAKGRKQGQSLLRRFFSPWQ